MKPAFDKSRFPMTKVIIQMSDRVAKVPIPATIFVIMCCVGIFFIFGNQLFMLLM